MGSFYKTNRLTSWAFIGSSVFLLVLGVVSFLRQNNQIISSEWVNHTYVVKLKLESVDKLLFKAESSQRGHLLTRDSAFENSFITAKNGIHSALIELVPLISDNPEQKANLAELSRI